MSVKKKSNGVGSLAESATICEAWEMLHGAVHEFRAAPRAERVDIVLMASSCSLTCSLMDITFTNLTK